MHLKSVSDPCKAHALRPQLHYLIEMRLDGRPFGGTAFGPAQSESDNLGVDIVAEIETCFSTFFTFFRRFGMEMVLQKVRQIKHKY